MPITRQQKEQVVRDLADKLNQAKSVVVSSFSNISVSEDQNLRKDIRKAGAQYQVVKKTLLKKAVETAHLPEIDIVDVSGNLAVAVASDEISAAKVLYNFTKDNENLSILAGYLEKELIDNVKILELAKLLSKDELITKTIATIKGPINGLVNVLVGNIRNFIQHLARMAIK